jgi:hypothetical protein
MNCSHAVSGVVQDMARFDFDRLEVRREQLEILMVELPEQIVLGPTGHVGFSWGRESAPACNLRFRGGTDGSKVHTTDVQPLQNFRFRIPGSWAIADITATAERR